ncbi:MULTISPECIES: L-serine ammonia-lyase [Kocuria]|uniref:L-serine dehydratase n=1 Tax=Kocuria subflava TaxID=1736139 RepID=A0A846TY64_9MICC|nr:MULTISPECIES: L-serine ammonia-lyase [Kocuria]NKE10137.1 L-serine ammonia-lyase [Kocuria subflava]
MVVSVFDLFSIGVGPSSSHTVGPMRAAADFVADLVADGQLESVSSVGVDLYGSLSSTGKGHGTFTAVLLGLEGHRPEQVAPETIDQRREALESGQPLQFAGALDGVVAPVELDFHERDIVQRPLTLLPYHPNGMWFRAFDADGQVLAERTAYSCGGGFVVVDPPEGTDPMADDDDVQVPYPYRTADELMALCDEHGLSVAELALANECARRPEAEVRAGLAKIADVMEESKNSNLRRTGCLPGGLAVRRRAPDWYARLKAIDSTFDSQYWVEWVNLVALTVNEENASGGRIVTAPTNGAAGIVPAVMFYATHYTPAARGHDARPREEIVADYLLAAGAVGALIKEQASISGAEVGCQGEVGSASSMAAAGLAQVMGGSAQQVENAAEIAMEHHLGLTCDPVGGLVQVPCIERNAIAAVTAVNAARMALFEDGPTHVSLDKVVQTMRDTGADMSENYKETARGGLAVSVGVNVVEC